MRVRLMRTHRRRLALRLAPLQGAAGVLLVVAGVLQLAGTGWALVVAGGFLLLATATGAGVGTSE